jgi:probable HAF family extracellular repeat protein
MLDLGALSGVNGHSEATAVNGLGHVVGSHNASIGQQAFLWTPQDGILDLNSLLDESGADWRLFAATDINDFGQIIGYGTHDPDGPGELFPENVAFLLTPLPEPTMLLILGAFGPLLVRRYRPQSTASAAVNGRGRRSNLPVSGPLMVVLLTIPLPLRAAPFTLIATHPDAAAQPTASGQILATLKPFNGKLYAGFGNYTSDDGPIGIRAFDPVTGQFTNQLLRTLRPPLPPIDGALSEAIFIYREIGGKLYAPHIDPPGTAADPQGDFSGYAVGIANGSAEAWTDFRVVPRGHMFDMATFDGNDLWVVGAVANNISLGATDGVAWRSRDGGVTWQESLRVPPQNTAVPVARLYSIHAYKGKLYTQGQNISPFMPHSTSKVFDGTSWSDGPSLGAGTTGNIWHPETFAGYMVYHRNHSGVDPDGSRLFKFDGTVASFAYTSERFYDYTIGGDALYALLTDGRIIKTTDLLSWSALDVAPADGRSLGILDNNLYLGATGGHLYRYSLAVPEPGSILALAAGLLFLRRKPRLDQPWAQRLQHELN